MIAPANLIDDMTRKTGFNQDYIEAMLAILKALNKDIGKAFMHRQLVDHIAGCPGFSQAMVESQLAKSVNENVYLEY